MALPEAAAAVATRRYQAKLATLAESRVPAVQRAWDETGNDAADVGDFVRRVTPTMALLTVAALRQSTAYYSVLTSVRPPAIRAADLVVPDESREPFIAYWRSLSSEGDPEVAMVAGRARAEAITRNRVMSAARRTGDLFVERARLKVEGWRRVANGGACDWCLSLTSNTYASSAAADASHDRCGCSTAPLLAS